MKTLFRHPLRSAVSLLVTGAGIAAVCVAVAQGAPERGPLRSAQTAVATPAAEARVIVKYRADSTLMRPLAASGPAAAPRHANALSNRLGFTLRDGRSIGARAQVLRAQGMSSHDLAERLAAQDDVEYAVVDGRKYATSVPNDPLYGPQTSVTPLVGQWYLRPPTSATIASATSVVSSINAQAAWDITTGNPAVVVADLDTGVRPDHPDLAAKLRPGYDFVTDTTVSVDGDGRDADPSDPGDYGCATGDTSSWHGTQVAGLIGAATNNGIGMAGVGYNVMLLPVRVLGKCGGYDSDIQAAMLWAAGVSANPTANAYPAKVINLSLGSTGACNAAYADVVRQVNAAGVVVVAAAGNDGLAVGTPANCAGVIAVAGVRHAGTKVSYSDLGPEIALAAPAGNCVSSNNIPCLYPLLTTSNSGSTTPVLGAAGAIYTGDGLNASIGTSFSSPLVAGTVGLMFSVNPGLTPAQVLAALKGTARPFPSSGSAATVPACTVPGSSSPAQYYECYCTTATCGAGLLDAGLAVAAVAKLSANATVASSSVVAGTPVTLDGSSSHPTTTGSSTATITGYQWAVVSGPATITSASNAATVTLLPSATGTVVVSLTVTDSTGQQAANSFSLSVAAPVVTPPPDSSSGGGGGGGGALGLAWLLGWLAAVFAVWSVTPSARARLRR